METIANLILMLRRGAAFCVRVPNSYEVASTTSERGIVVFYLAARQCAPSALCERLVRDVLII